MFKHLPDPVILTQALDDLLCIAGFDGGNSLSKFRQTICSYLVFITDYCLFIEITGGHKFFEREKKYKIKSVNKLSWEKTLCEIRARKKKHVKLEFLEFWKVNFELNLSVND